MESHVADRRCPLCGVAVGGANIELHALRCPGPANRGRSVSEGSWGDGSASPREGTGAAGPADDADADVDAAADEALQLAMALSLSTAAAGQPEEAPPNAWSCSGCTVTKCAQPHLLAPCTPASVSGQDHR